jgi:D-arabinose 1-dehydrogenase-like Zn-dependent alcohol dehydrogenase
MQSRTLSRELALLMLGQTSDRGSSAPALPTGMEGLLQQVLATLSQDVRESLDRSAEDLQAAQAQGADVIFDNRSPDTAAALKAAAGGPIRGVIDFVGSGQTASLAMAVAVKGTVIVIVGLMGGSLEIALPLLSPRNLTVRGSHVGTLDELKELVEYSRQGQLPGIPLTRRPMSEVNEALTDLEQGKSIGRIVLTPNQLA